MPPHTQICFSQIQRNGDNKGFYKVLEIWGQGHEGMQ